MISTPTLGAGDREFESLHFDTRENHCFLLKPLVITERF